MDDEQLERWKRTRKVLSQLLKVTPSEEFVDQVMRKVEAIPVRRPVGWRLGLGRLLHRIQIPGWLYPELGLATVALLLFLTGLLSRQPSVSTETLLLSRLPGRTQWVGQSEPLREKEISDWDILWEGV